MSRESDLRYESYDHGGHPEWLMRLGPSDGFPILFVPALFEEANRTRAFLVATMRKLGESGFACWLPDLPGTGESARALEDCGLPDWIGAVRAVAERARSPGRPLMVVSFRGGTLLDDLAEAAHWRFAPAEGAALLRDLSRSGLVGGQTMAGYPVPEHLRSELSEAPLPDVSPCWTVRLASDPKPSDAKLDGPALWRRSEPSGSDELAGLIASDLIEWAGRCGCC